VGRRTRRGAARFFAPQWQDGRVFRSLREPATVFWLGSARAVTRAVLVACCDWTGSAGAGPHSSHLELLRSSGSRGCADEVDLGASSSLARALFPDRLLVRDPLGNDGFARMRELKIVTVDAQSEQHRTFHG
jgi:hypothetical protein